MCNPSILKTLAYSEPLLAFIKNTTYALAIHFFSHTLLYELLQIIFQ